MPEQPARTMRSAVDVSVPSPSGTIMSFIDRKAPSNSRLCKIGATIDTLPAAEGEALERMLEDSAWSNSAIADATREEGVRVSRHVITAHRAKTCLCAN